MYASRAEVTADIRRNLVALGLSWQDVASYVRRDIVWTTAACLGQFTFDRNMTDLLVELFELGEGADVWLMGASEPMLAPADMHRDPFLRSLVEVVSVHGRSLRTVVVSEFGDVNLRPASAVSIAGVGGVGPVVDRIEIKMDFPVSHFREAPPPVPPTPPEQIYRTNAWDSKFQFGAYSTLLSSYVLGTQFREFIIDIADPSIASDSLRDDLNRIINAYDRIDLDERNRIVELAGAHETPTIFDEYRSALISYEQNAKFIAAMASHPELKPVDSIILLGRFMSDSFQYNAHRGLYNNAFLIPQNSLAAIVNAYVAGIRTVELDVLETLDLHNVVVHDLVTNRLDGSFHAPANYVEQTDLAELGSVVIGILDPTNASPTVVDSGLKGLMRTELVLHRIADLMPELTIYIDARNYSPISIIPLLTARPELVDKVVTKIYPFTLPGGAYDFVEVYAERHKISSEQAWREVASANMNVLLAMGSVPSQASESVRLSLAVIGFDFADMERLRPSLPFATGSTLGLNQFHGVPIFDELELAWIEARTWSTVQWCLGFCSIANVLVFQQNLTPSLARLAADQTPENLAEFMAMPAGERRNAAIIDNFNQIYTMMMRYQIHIQVKNMEGEFVDAAEVLRNTVFGFSDRYPDFSFAERTGSGAVDPSTIKDFLYKMDGTIYQKEDYAAIKMRSSEAVAQKIAELRGFGLPPQYATTDLPTDLRAMEMGMMGTLGLPQDLTFRASGIVKSRLNPPDISSYTPPAWTQRLFGDAYAIDPASFDADFNRIRALVQRLRNLQLAYASIHLALEDPTGIIMDVVALGEISETVPIMAKDVDRSLLENARVSINREETDVANDIQRYNAQFEAKYGVKFAKYIYFDDDPSFPVYPPT